MTDREIYMKVRYDASAGAGGMVAVAAIINMLDALQARFGERFTIAGAINALDALIRMAELFKSELQNAKNGE